MSEAAEEFRLLAGEEYSSAGLDARHWVRVYKELVEFCELMLTRPELSAENGHLRRRLDHYYSRLEHWQAGLSAAQPDTSRYEERLDALDNRRQGEHP